MGKLPKKANITGIVEFILHNKDFSKFYFELTNSELLNNIESVTYIANAIIVTEAISGVVPLSLGESNDEIVFNEILYLLDKYGLIDKAAILYPNTDNDTSQMTESQEPNKTLN